MPCDSGSPIACMSVMNTIRPAILWPFAARPNSAAALMALMVSVPALARATIFALEACAWRRYALKSVVPSGCATSPSTVPPSLRTSTPTSCARVLPNA